MFEKIHKIYQDKRHHLHFCPRLWDYCRGIGRGRDSGRKQYYYDLQERPMVSREKALELIQESLDSLYRSNVIEEQVKVNDDTVFLGTNALLDSLGFVTFVTDLEERLVDETDLDVYFDMDNLQDYCGKSLILTPELLSGYMTTLKED